MDFSAEHCIFCKITASCVIDGKVHDIYTLSYTLNMFVFEASLLTRHFPATFNITVTSNLNVSTYPRI